MASTVWKGHLTFGLVSMPVRLVRAARAERVKLRQLYRPRAHTMQAEEESPDEAVAGTSRSPQARVVPPKELAAKTAQRSMPEPEEVHVAPVRRAFQAADESEPVSA